MNMSEKADELSLIDLVSYLKDFWSLLLKKKMMVVIISLFFVVMGIIISLVTQPKYIAKSSLMLESSKSSGMSGALALASQFGLLGNSSSSVIDEDKLLELVKSETIIKTALFKKVVINGKKDFLANHYIDWFNYQEKFDKTDSLKNFRFKNQRENLTKLENKVFKLFYSQISSNLTCQKTKSGIITIEIKSKSELFSKHFNDCLLEALTTFYVNRVAEKGKKNVEIIQSRVDSVAEALRNSEEALARWKDGNFQLVKAQGMMNEIKLRRNVEVNNSMYIEGIKQLEVSKFNLLQETPFLQVIDKPSFPLEESGKISMAKGIILGAVAGLFFSILYIFAHKTYKKIMLELENKEKHSLR